MSNDAEPPTLGPEAPEASGVSAPERMVRDPGSASAEVGSQSDPTASAGSEVRMGTAPGEASPERASREGGRSRHSEVESHTARALVSLRELLIRGEFAPGERMAELPLVARLGVSRTPIRLALERLAHMGLLDVSASGGFTVRGYSPTEALDAIEIRGVLEGTAARLAAERLGDVAEIATLRRLGDEMERLERLTFDSFARYMDLNEAFHAQIIELAKSEMLKRAVQHAVSLPFASPSAMVFPTSGFAHADATLAIAKEHHRGIVEAIAKRQGTRAESLAREHAFVGRRVLALALSDSEAFSRIPGASLINLSAHAKTRTR